MLIRRIMLLASGALLAGACTSGVTIPTIPPIPSIPPFELPSGLPTIPPGVLPSADAGSGVCLLVSPAEMSSIMGNAATVTSSESDACSYTFANFTTVTLTLDTGDLSTAQILFGDSARDLTVGGLPAKSGVFIGQPAVFVARNGETLQVQGILVGDDDATMAKLVQVAELAVSRWP